MSRGLKLVRMLASSLSLLAHIAMGSMASAASFGC